MNWLKKIFQKKKSNSPFHVVKQGNQILLFDEKTKEYLESNLPDPKQSDLDELAENSVRIIISKRTLQKGTRKTVPLKILEIGDDSGIKEMASGLEIFKRPAGHVLCDGDYLFDFVRKDGKESQIELFGSGAVRWTKKWRNDGQLKSPGKFFQWMDSLGITEPLQQWKERAEKKTGSENRFNAWKAIAPPSLAKFVDEITRDPFGIDGQKIFEELKKDNPDENELILDLFGLYGHYFSRWNEVPVYEMLPAQALMSQDIDALNKAFGHESLTSEQKEGMARFLSDWGFTQKRRSDLAKINDRVKEMLLKHLEEFQNEDKIELFEKRVMNK